MFLALLLQVLGYPRTRVERMYMMKSRSFASLMVWELPILSCSFYSWIDHLALGSWLRSSCRSSYWEVEESFSLILSILAKNWSLVLFLQVKWGPCNCLNTQHWNSQSSNTIGLTFDNLQLKRKPKNIQNRLLWLFSSGISQRMKWKQELIPQKIQLFTKVDVIFYVIWSLFKKV